MIANVMAHRSMVRAPYRIKVGVESVRDFSAPAAGRGGRRGARSGLPGAQRQADDQAGHEADPEGGGDGLGWVVADDVLRRVEAVAGLVGPLAVLLAEAVPRLL